MAEFDLLQEHAGGLFIDHDRSLQNINAPFWVRITEFDGVQYYGWVEQQYNRTGLTGEKNSYMEDSVCPREGTIEDNPAWEPNCNLVQVNSLAMIQRAYLDELYGWTWVIVQYGTNLCPQSGSGGSGSGGEFCGCNEVAECYQVTFPGVESGDNCSQCSALTGIILLHQQGDCLWVANGDEFGMECFQEEVAFQINRNLPGQAFLDFADVFGILATYSASTVGWDCLTPITLTKLTPSGTDADIGNICKAYPETITVQPCAGFAVPTVTQDTGDVCSDASSFTITGTNFTAPASSNTVDLRDSANVAIAHTVDGGTTTGLALTLTAPPIANLGAVTAVVTNANGDSGAPIQVATVIDCSGFFWLDTFTGVDGTGLTLHAPEVGSLYMQFPGIPILEIQSDRAVAGSFGSTGFGTTGNGSAIAQQSHVGDQTGTASFQLGSGNTNAVALDVTNDDGTSVFCAMVTNNAASLPIAGAADVLYIIEYSIAGGTFTVRASVACPVNLSTTYSITLQNVGGFLTATVNGNSCTFDMGQPITLPMDWYLEVYTVDASDPPDLGTYFEGFQVT